MLPTLRDLFVQCLAHLVGHARVVDLLRLRLRDVADHGPARDWCTRNCTYALLPVRAAAVSTGSDTGLRCRYKNI
eukprot:5361892-Pleurochrysis_carterae.AAC.2